MLTKAVQTKDVLSDLLGTSVPTEQAAKVRQLLNGPTTIVVHVNPLVGDVQVVPVGKDGMSAGDMRDVLMGVCEMLLRQERRDLAQASSLVTSKDGGQ